ncbi:methyl-accepting chemotaxis protein [Aquincola sp. MAHUQ-54]|uniref:Methyl-accepting chemotaxis protein n=1 Tax=Aquincola agrisoli TaxID=3119538 RepID=A0AAW9Q998_9BURK
MSLKNLSLRAQLGAAFGGLAAVVLVVAGLSLTSLDDANSRFSGYVDGINARAILAAHLRTAVDRRAIAARNLVLVTRPEDLALEKAEVQKAHDDVRRALGELKQAIAIASDASEQARRLVAEMDRIESAYGPVALAIVDLALAGRRDEAIVRMNDECRPLLASLAKVENDYAELTEQRARDLSQEAVEHAAEQRALLALVCLFAVAAAAVAGLVITRRVTRALGAEPADLGQAAERVAAGDLRPLAGMAHPPARSVFASLMRMQHNLSMLVAQVRDASECIARDSRQIAHGNIDLSQRTEEQASALEQTAATMDELGTTVHHNAENARRANELALGASSVAARGGEVVGQVVETMKGINASSKRIADIIGTIDGIAFQTNILALNAAVEAARAGEQGRGFAVVAGEVRTLAKRAADAAKEIKTLISGSVTQVEQGTALVDRAGQTMDEIVGAIHRVSETVAAITEASAEQSSGVAQVGQAVSQIDQVTQQNAALVEQSAAASDNLSRQAHGLVEAVSAFKLAEAAPA